MQLDNIVNDQSNVFAKYNQFNAENKSQNNEEQFSLEKEIDKAAVKVSISMNAQIVLFALDSKSISTNNTTAQNNIFSFLSGKEVENELSLSDLGYTGKPISKLSIDEAKNLIDEEGFFGVAETSKRVSNFVFDFAGYDLELLEKGREGIVQGFEEAQKLWGGELPEISHQTQENTLLLIDARIADIKAKNKS